MSGPPVYSFRKKVSDIIPRNGLVAEWLFSGNDLDTSGNGNDAIANNATLTTDRKGNANRAYNFDVSNQRIDMNNYPDLQTFSAMTISLWINLNVVETGKVILWKSNLGVTNGGYAVQVFGDKIRFLISGSGGNRQVITTTPIVVGNWHHIAAVYNGSSISIYFDATPEDSNLITGTINNTTEKLIIGNVSTGQNFYINAVLDDIRIYDRALSQEEITILANE